MKAIKSLSKVIISLILALALTTLTACDVLNDFFGKGGNGGEGDVGGEGNGTTYSVTLDLDGGDLDEPFTEYTSGTVKTLPTPTKDYYDFVGWYETADKDGNSVTAIPSSATGDKTFYAKWTPKTYTITYYVNNKVVTTQTPTSYVYGVGAALPTPSNPNYNFNGWYEGSMSGNKVTEISVTDHGNKIYYATSEGKTFNITLNLGGGTLAGGNVIQYTFGEGKTLPTPTLKDKVFAGWYTAASGGTKVTAVGATESGNKEYWARWREPGALNATFGGYEEGAFVELELDQSVSLDAVEVSYKSNNGSTVTLSGKDKEYLIRRISDDTVRADIVGIEAGTCEISVNVNGEPASSDPITVKAYDRSGYAYFNYTNGVGGYTDNGTPKSNAEIIYVTEQTKNSVTASYLKSDDGVGLVSVLKYSYRSSKPVIVRIIGRISAPTWAHKDGQPMIAYTKQGAKITAQEVIDQTKEKLGITLSARKYTQQELIDNYGFELEKGITKLVGLTSEMTVASDTDWNDCQIGGSSSNAKNVTVEGIGTDAEIFQWGMTWKYASSIEIRNLTFTDYTEDACSFQGASTSDVTAFKSYNIWVHNCTFNRGKSYWDLSDDQDKADGDGATDFKNVGNVTVSYNRYYYNHKTGLVGSGDTSYSSNVTFHHNFYDQCQSRLPMGRQANIHMFNNYYRATSDYCLSARNNMYAFVEACYFEYCNDTIRTETNAVVKLWGCEFIGCSYNSSYAITNATSRSQGVANNNFMNPTGSASNYCLDNDANMFYLNSNGTTKVSLLNSAADAKWECINNAGVHKASDWLPISTDAALNSYFPLIKN